MKKNFLAIIICCTVFHNGFAQTYYKDSDPKVSQYPSRNNKKSELRSAYLQDPFVLISIGPLNQYHPATKGLLTSTFPYSYTNTLPNTIFPGSIQSPYSVPKTFWEFNMQLGARRHFGELKIALAGNGDYLIGAGYVRRLNKIGFLGGRVFFKAQIDFTGYIISKKFGSIDNDSKTVYMLGYRFDPTFETHSRYGSTTHDAKFINVNYQQNVYAFIPGLAMELHPFGNRCFFEVNANYVLPLSQRGYVELEQHDDHGNVGSSKTLKLSQAGLSNNFNGTPITQTPFNLAGVQLGVKLVYLSPFSKSRSRKRGS